MAHTIENVTDLNPTVLAFAQLLVALPLVTGVRFYEDNDMDVLVEDEPVYVELTENGFRRVDFSINVPLGNTPEVAVESFAQMLVLPFEELREAYGTTVNA